MACHTRCQQSLPSSLVQQLPSPSCSCQAPHTAVFVIVHRKVFPPNKSSWDPYRSGGRNIFVRATEETGSRKRRVAPACSAKQSFWREGSSHVRHMCCLGWRNVQVHQGQVAATEGSLHAARCSSQHADWKSNLTASARPDLHQTL